MNLHRVICGYIETVWITVLLLVLAMLYNVNNTTIAEGLKRAYPFLQAVGPVAVTSLLLGNTQHGLGHLAGVTFPASVINPDTNKTVAYSPNSPGIYDFEQTQINNAAHNVRVQTFISLLNTLLQAGKLRRAWYYKCINCVCVLFCHVSSKCDRCTLKISKKFHSCSCAPMI